MSQDRCEECGHIWHGLECEAKSYLMDANHRWDRVKCRCPSAWKPPAVLVEGDALQGVRGHA